LDSFKSWKQKLNNRAKVPKIRYIYLASGLRRKDEGLQARHPPKPVKKGQETLKAYSPERGKRGVGDRHGGSFSRARKENGAGIRGKSIVPKTKIFFEKWFQEGENGGRGQASLLSCFHGGRKFLPERGHRGRPVNHRPARRSLEEKVRGKRNGGTPALFSPHFGTKRGVNSCSGKNLSLSSLRIKRAGPLFVCT